jgi:hypothetical protein
VSLGSGIAVQSTPPIRACAKVKSVDEAVGVDGEEVEIGTISEEAELEAMKLTT